MSVGTAGLIAAGVGAAGAVGGALINKSASGSAASAQLQAQREGIAAQKEQAQAALDFQREQSDIARKDLQPFRNIQLSALQGLRNQAKSGSAAERANRGQATEAIQRQLAAQGLLRSTAQGDQLSNLEVGLIQNRQNLLSQLAGSGAATNQANIASQLGAGQAQIASNLGQQIGSSAQATGQIIGQNALAQGQIGSGLVGQLGNIGQNLIQSTQGPTALQQAIIDSLRSGNTNSAFAALNVGQG